MQKNFDSSSSSINNETKIALYIKIAKTLILSLPDINDKVKAFAWFRKIIFDNSSLIVRIEYLQIFVKFLKQKKLSGPFAGLPDTRRSLQKLNTEIKQQYVRCENNISHGLEVPTGNFDTGEDYCLAQNNNCNTVKYDYMKIIRVNKSEYNMKCLSKNNSNRISAGYSPFTKKEFKRHTKNIMNSPDDENEKIERCRDMLAANYLPCVTPDEIKLNKHNFSKTINRGEKERKYQSFDPVYEKYNETFENIICNDNFIQRAECKFNYPKNKKRHQRSLDDKSNVNMLTKLKLKEENKNNNESNPYWGIGKKNSDVKSFLFGSEKYLTLCVSKECLVEHNILKCFKYIVNNAKCKFFKFKEYYNSEKIINMMTSKHASNTSKKERDEPLLNKDTRRNSCLRSIPETDKKNLLNNDSIFSRMRNFIINNVSFENTSNIFRNVLESSIYVKISIILAVGIIFFCKIYQVIFAYQCKKISCSSQLVAHISKFNGNTYSRCIFTIFSCFIIYQLLKDFIGIFF